MRFRDPVAGVPGAGYPDLGRRTRVGVELVEDFMLVICCCCGGGAATAGRTETPNTATSTISNAVERRY